MKINTDIFKLHCYKDSIHTGLKLETISTLKAHLSSSEITHLFLAVVDSGTEVGPEVDLRSTFWRDHPGCPMQQLSFFVPFSHHILGSHSSRTALVPAPTIVFSNSIKACG